MPDIGIAFGLAVAICGFSLAAYAWGYRSGQRETEERWREAVERAEADRQRAAPHRAVADLSEYRL